MGPQISPGSVFKQFLSCLFCCVSQQYSDLEPASDTVLAARAAAVAAQEISAEIRTSAAELRQMEHKAAAVGDYRPHAVCTVQTFRNAQTGELLIVSCDMRLFRPFFVCCCCLGRHHVAIVTTQHWPSQKTVTIIYVEFTLTTSFLCYSQGRCYTCLLHTTNSWAGGKLSCFSTLPGIRLDRNQTLNPAFSDICDPCYDLMCAEHCSFLPLLAAQRCC